MIPLAGMIRYDRKDRVSGQQVHVYQHHTGFKIDIIQKHGFQNKFAGFLVPFGSQHTLYRDKKSGQFMRTPLGTAHFLEHCILSGEDPAMSRLTSLGVDTDAYTAATHTFYSFTCVDSFAEALELHFQAIFRPDLNDAKTRREAEVINAEYSMYKEDLSTVAGSILLRGLFSSPEMYEDILGNAESIDKITTEDLKRMHENYYTPQNLSLILVGSFQEEAMIKAVSSWLDALNGAPEASGSSEQGGERGAAALAGNSYPNYVDYRESGIYIPLENDDRVLVHEQRLELPSSTSSFWLGYRAKISHGSERRNGHELVGSRLTGELLLDMLIGPGSEAFEIMYQAGLLDESLTYQYLVEPDYAYLFISGDSRQPERAAELIAQHLERGVSERLFDEKRMNELLRSKLGAYLRSLDDVSECGEAAARIRLAHLEFTDYSSVFYKSPDRTMFDELDFVTPENRAKVIVHGRRRN